MYVIGAALRPPHGPFCVRSAAYADARVDKTGQMRGSRSAAEELLIATLAGLPRSAHGYLVPAGEQEAVPLARVSDPQWLAAQIGLQSRRWPSVDRRVRATLWWYSVSQVFVTPTLASLFVTGRALSPRPADVELHRLADGNIFTARSLAVLDVGPVDDPGTDPGGGPVRVSLDPVVQVAAALRDSLEFAIPALAAAGAGREPPLWAIATDSLANRLLWLGKACGQLDRATALAARIADLIGSALPAPRYVSVARSSTRGGTATFVRRASCCLVYLEPGEAKCASCPRQTPEQRTAQLSAAANFA